jgi:hypothetical protein
MWTVQAYNLGRSFFVVHSDGRCYMTKNLKRPKARRWGRKEDAQAQADTLNAEARKYGVHRLADFVD